MSSTTVGHYEAAIQASECARPDIAALIASSSKPQGNRRRQPRRDRLSQPGAWVANTAVAITLGTAVLSTLALVV